MKAAVFAVVMMCAAVGVGQQATKKTDPTCRTTMRGICISGILVPGTTGPVRSIPLGTPKNEGITITSATGRVDRLSDEEYARLEKMRKALSDEEAAIAKAHNVKFEMDSCHTAQSHGFAIACTQPAAYPDQWEIRGQFLLVNVPSGVGR